MNIKFGSKNMINIVGLENSKFRNMISSSILKQYWIEYAEFLNYFNENLINFSMWMQFDKSKLINSNLKM